ncbi:dihydrodipicolinate synthase family protein [Arhodomonas sp. SL1]|uniref:dihydrodipicolinate synthase family protein n=1 Tax=Arhodomonas sp. SL1 TaxID=3425691 RepID=UPI003F883881
MPRTSAELIADPVGRFPHATVACFDATRGELPRRHLDPERMRAFLERLAERGVEGLLIASSTGQGHLRTVEELTEWFECAASAHIGEAVPMALLRPEDGEAANTRLMDQVAGQGYPVVFLRPGTDLPPDADGARVAASLAPLVAAAADRGLAVGLYSISDVSGLPLSPEATARVLAGPGGGHIVAVKVTEVDYAASTARFLADPRLQRLKIVQGWDPHLAQALQDGPGHDPAGRPRAGITSGAMSFALEQYLHILSAAAAGDWREVQRALEAVTRLFRAMQDDPRHFPDLQRAKYIMGLGQPLIGTVEAGQAARILTALEALPRAEDRVRIARSLDLMGDGPFHGELRALADTGGGREGRQ